MSSKLNEPRIVIKINITVPKISSYDKSWDIDRIEPINAYLELLAQPDKITLYTFKELNVNKSNKLKLEFTNKLLNEKGNNVQSVKLNDIIKIGANKKIKKFAFEGTIISFKINFIPSAIGCIKPKYPVTVGPKRRCIDAIILRSTNVKKAITTNKGISINKFISIKSTTLIY